MANLSRIEMPLMQISGFKRKHQLGLLSYYADGGSVPIYLVGRFIPLGYCNFSYNEKNKKKFGKKDCSTPFKVFSVMYTTCEVPKLDA